MINGLQHADYKYLDLLNRIINEGTAKGDRTGTGTLSVFGHQMRFDLELGFPLLTTKKVHMKSIIHEMLWFLSGSQNIAYLKENGVKIWDDWADENGELGPVYGYQWRHWDNGAGGEIDQIAELIETLKTNPDDRRMIVSAWNPTDLRFMKLPPCHLLFQFWTRVRPDGRRGLSCQMYQRSCDTFLGVPFNIASYALLTHMIAHVTGMVAEEFVWVGGDTHIYRNHISQCIEQLSRDPRPMPTLEIADRKQGIDDFLYDDFKVIGYDPHPVIKGAISV